MGEGVEREEEVGEKGGRDGSRKGKREEEEGKFVWKGERKEKRK